MDVNLDLLRERAGEIREALERLSPYARLSREEFCSNEERTAAAKYRLIVAIEAALSICNHLCSRVARKAPETFADCFRILGKEGIISEALAQRLSKMARFRNLVIHLYWQVDNSRVHRILQEDARDLEEYLAQVGHFLKEIL